MKEPNLFDDPKEITEAMRQALARAYADNDFKSYIIKIIQGSHQNALSSLDMGHADNARYYANRAKAFKQLLEKSKHCFEHFESIRLKLKAPLTKVEVLKEVKL